ncbi:hypothetical protein H0H92_005783 [Tricholoma furcatifolium]|nr:hypothetical protein H0H92_005783 [Tricholoma furcatifolium]
MPPHKCPRRIEDGSSSTSSQAELASRSIFPPDATVNIVLKVPVEIWLEIASFFVEVVVPAEYSWPSLPPATLEREQALLALSQLCRRLRDLFLPHLWKRFEVCADKGSEVSSSRYKLVLTNLGWRNAPACENQALSWEGISKELKRRSNVLLSSPHLQRYVHTVNIVIPPHLEHDTLTAFAKCLEELPSLHTLQILHADRTIRAGVYHDIFKWRVLLIVRTVILPTRAHGILRACPNVKMVICNDGGGREIVGAMKYKCKHVTMLMGIDSNKPLLNRIIENAPLLEEIGFARSIKLDNLRILANLKKIRSIKLSLQDEGQEEVITLAQQILREAASDDKEGYCQ